MTPPTPALTVEELQEIRDRLNERSVIANNWCDDCDRLLKEVERLKKAMRGAMSDMPSDQSRGYERLSIALGEP